MDPVHITPMQVYPMRLEIRQSYRTLGRLSDFDYARCVRQFSQPSLSNREFHVVEITLMKIEKLHQRTKISSLAHGFSYYVCRSLDLFSVRSTLRTVPQRLPILRKLPTSHRIRRRPYICLLLSHSDAGV